MTLSRREVWAGVPVIAVGLPMTPHAASPEPCIILQPGGCKIKTSNGKWYYEVPIKIVVTESADVVITDIKTMKVVFRETLVTTVVRKLVLPETTEDYIILNYEFTGRNSGVWFKKRLVVPVCTYNKCKVS